MLKKKLKIFTIIVIILLVGLSSIIKIPNSIAIVGQIFPAGELILVRNQNELITVRNIDNLYLSESSTTIFSFERGDIITIDFDPMISIGTQVSKGDTLCIINSVLLENKKEDLLGEILAAKENLKIYLTGEKTPYIVEAQERYNQALAKFENQQNIYNRNLKLYQDSLISNEEFEIQKSLFRISETDVLISQAQLDAISQGAKSEIIALQKQIIENLNRQYQLLQGQIASGIITSHLDGIVTISPSQDTVLVIKNIDDHIFISPIPFKYMQSLKENQNFKINLPKSDSMITDIKLINRDITFIDGKETFYIAAKIENNPDLINGQILEAKLIIGKRSVAKLFMEFFN